MTVTAGLSAVEALTKAKNEGGFAKAEYRFRRWFWHPQGWFEAQMLEGTWRPVSNNLIDPAILLEPWEHHATSDTL